MVQTSIISLTQKAEEGESRVWSQPGKVSETLSQKQKENKMARGIAQVAQLLLAL
jgi:hypothetical protein